MPAWGTRLGVPASSATLATALRHHQAGALVEAGRLYQQILSAEPHHADALHLLGVLSNQLGDPKLAVQLITQAIAQNSSADAYHNNLGNAWIAAGDTIEAEVSFRRAIALKRSNADAHANLGRLLKKQGRFEDAERCFVQALRSAPRMLGAHMALGAIALVRGDAKAALKSYKHAVRAAPRDAAAHNGLGNALLAAGDPQAAIRSYLQAQELDPQAVDPCFNLGNLYLQAREYAAAVALFEKALEYGGPQADIWNSLGLAQSGQDNQEEAIRACLQALACRPDYAEAHLNLAMAFEKTGLVERAIASFKEAIRIRPGYTKAWQNLGSLHQALKDYAAAIECFQEAVRCEPDRYDLHNNLGLALAGNNDTEAASESFSQALFLNPSSADACFNLGNVAASQGNPSLALERFQQAIALQPDHVKAWQNLGVAQQALGDLPAALAAWRHGLSIAPHQRDLMMNMAVILVAQGDRESLHYLERIVDEEPASPGAHWDLALALLLHGDYIRGWQEYEWRWEYVRSKFGRERRALAPPEWHGEPLDGRSILICAEQGFGDTLQFARYAPLVGARGGRVILEVQPELYSLLRTTPGIEHCIRRGDPLPETACFCPLMSLPGLFGTTLETIPPVLSNLLTSRVSGCYGTPLRVGLVWAGNPQHTDDKLRSLALHELAPLAALAGVEFVSLQKGSPAAQRVDGSWPTALPDALAGVNDFAGTADVIRTLDLVLTVDTAVAHLAGSMGWPVWLLLSHKPEWRWGLKADTSPWYPTARLFRRAPSEQWSDVVGRVASALSGLVSQNISA